MNPPAQTGDWKARWETALRLAPTTVSGRFSLPPLTVVGFAILGQLSQAMIREETRTKEVEFTASVVVCDVCGEEFRPQVDVITSSLSSQYTIEITEGSTRPNEGWTRWNAGEETIHLCEKHDLREMLEQT